MGAPSRSTAIDRAACVFVRMVRAARIARRYGTYGRKSDWQTVINSGVDVSGKIGLVRYPLRWVLRDIPQDRLCPVPLL